MKTVEFIETSKGYIAEVNGVVVWFIRDEPRSKPREGWFVYKSEDGGVTFKLIPARSLINEKRDVIGDTKWGWDSLNAAKAFIYKEELA